MNFREFERFDLPQRGLVGSRVLPGSDVAEVRIVAEGVVVPGLIFFAKMAAARFVTRQRVERQNLSEFEKIGDAAGVFDRLIEAVSRAEDADVGPELVAQRAN